MTTAAPTMETIPSNLAGHPDGDDIRKWTIYDEHHGMIAAWAHGKKTRSAFLPHIEALDLMVPRYDPNSDEPSNLGLGRTILAYRLAVYDLLPTKPQWAQRMRDNLARLI